MLDIENLEKWEDAHQVRLCIYVNVWYFVLVCASVHLLIITTDCLHHQVS